MIETFDRNMKILRFLDSDWPFIMPQEGNLKSTFSIVSAIVWNISEYSVWIQIAISVLKQMETTNGAYIPPSLHKGRFIFFAIDNSDFNEDTPDDKNTLHATAMVVFQQQEPGDQSRHLYITSTPPSDRSLSDVSKFTQVFDDCNIKGNPKPKETPVYPDFKKMQNR